jgi:hypothetical protein
MPAASIDLSGFAESWSRLPFVRSPLSARISTYAARKGGRVRHQREDDRKGQHAERGAGGIEFERIAGPQPQQTLKERPERESAIARPVRQNHYARQGEADRKRADRSAGPAGNAPAADAKAPMWSARPEGKASSRFPENGTPWTCPITVLRSGRVWSNRIFKSWGSSDAATVSSRAWLPARRSGSAA